MKDDCLLLRGEEDTSIFVSERCLVRKGLPAAAVAMADGEEDLDRLLRILLPPPPPPDDVDVEDIRTIRRKWCLIGVVVVAAAAVATAEDILKTYN